MYYVYTWCLQKPEKVIRFFGIDITDGCEKPYGCWEMDESLSSSKIGSELFLQALNYFLYFSFVVHCVVWCFLLQLSLAVSL